MSFQELHEEAQYETSLAWASMTGSDGKSSCRQLGNVRKENAQRIGRAAMERNPPGQVGRYHDIVQLIQRHGDNIYRDFEGFADPEPILRKCMGPNDPSVWAWELTGAEGELLEAIRSITLNILFEGVSQTGLESLPDFTGIVELCLYVESMLTCKSWIRVTDEEIRNILQGK